MYSSCHGSGSCDSYSGPCSGPCCSGCPPTQLYSSYSAPPPFTAYGPPSALPHAVHIAPAPLVHQMSAPLSHMPSHMHHDLSSIPKPQTPQNMPYAPNQSPSLPPGVLAQEKRMLKVDMMGHAWAVIEIDFLKDPIFVPQDRLNGAADGDLIFVSIKRRPDSKLYARVEKILVKAISALANPPQKIVSPPVSQPSQAPVPVYNPYAPIPITYQPKKDPVPANLGASQHPPLWVPPAHTPPPGQPQNYIQPPKKAVSAPLAGPVPNVHYSAPNPYAASSPHVRGPIQSSPNPYAKPQSYLAPSALPPRMQVSKGQVVQRQVSPSSVGYLAARPSSFKVVEGVLMHDKRSEAYVVPNDSNEIVLIPREYLAGASNGDLVRAHVIREANGNEPRLGVVLFRVGIHPSMASSESAPDIKDDEASGTFYPDIEHWSSSPTATAAVSMPVLAHDAMPSAPPIDDVQQIAPQLPSAHYAAPSQMAPKPESHPIHLAAPSSPLPAGALPLSRAHSKSGSFGSSSQALPVSPSSVSLGNRKPSQSHGGLPFARPAVPPAIYGQLKQIFTARAKSHPPTLSYAEFVSALDSLGDYEALSRAFFDAANRAGWKIAGGGGGADAINLESFSHFILTILFSDEFTQLRWSFSVLDPLETGFITRDVIRVQTELVFRLMLNMLLPVYLANPSDMAEYMWSLLDDKREGRITVDQYVEMMSKNRNAIIGLGLAQMPSATPMPIPKRGYPVYPGHPSWALVLQMMCGLSRALQAAQDSSDYRSVSVPAGAHTSVSSLSTPNMPHSNALGAHLSANGLPIQAFRQSNKFELRTVMSLQSKLIFTDYAPSVFRRIRELRGIDDATYLYSLGIEQVLGNFLFGKLTTLAKEGSSGKSGQFFFTSHDGRFLIKTIAKHERNTLYKMLPGYLAHLQNYPSSLLVPIYGMHDIDQLTIIVMGNVFNSPYVMDAAWDLKGSVVGRSSPGSFVKKDLDFDRGFVFGPQANAALARQIRLDAQYLKSMNIVDYSMLAGYHVLTVDEAAVHEHRDLPATAHPYFDVGLRSYDPHTGSLKNEVWYLGIIDVLIQFGVLKKAENFVKSLVHDPQGISIIPPDQYCERFSNYLVSCIR